MLCRRRANESGSAAPVYTATSHWSAGTLSSPGNVASLPSTLVPSALSVSLTQMPVVTTGAGETVAADRAVIGEHASPRSPVASSAWQLTTLRVPTRTTRTTAWG